MRKLSSFFDGKKIYLFCSFVVVSIPFVNLYVHSLSFESMFFGECFFIYAMLNRSTQTKIAGHKLKEYFK
jgi:hypothetical protein